MNQQNGEQPSEDIGQADKTVEEIPTEITLENGAVLAIRKPATMLLSNVMLQLQKTDPIPEPPMVFIEEKGREEENPNDPAYKAAMLVWNANSVVRMFNALSVASLSIKDLNEAYDPEGDDFADFLEAVMIDRAPGKAGRFIQWLNDYALVKNEARQLTHWMMRLAGVAEEDVAEATKFLESDTERSADSVPSA